MEYEQASYNIEEHNHIEWSTERLEARIEDIQHRMGMITYSGERLAQNERELDLLSLELAARYRDKKLGEIALAWQGREEVMERVWWNAGHLT